MSLSEILGIVAAGSAIAGSFIAVGLVLAKINKIAEIGTAVADLVVSNHKQDMLLARITTHLGISSRSMSFYESGDGK